MGNYYMVNRCHHSFFGNTDGEHFTALFGWMGIGIASVSIVGFMVSRAVLAIGEAGNFPAAIKQLQSIFQKKKGHLLPVFLIQAQM